MISCEIYWKYNEAIATAPQYKGIYTTLGSLSWNARGSASTPHENIVVYKVLVLTCEGKMPCR